MRRAFRVLATFVAGSILTYVVVLVGAFTFWSFVPTRDPTKQMAATMFLIVGPAVALAGGLWLAAWAATGRAQWPVSAFARGREIRRRRVAAAMAQPIPSASRGERVIGWLFALVGGSGIALGTVVSVAFWGGRVPVLGIPAVHLLPVVMLAVVGLFGPAALGGIGLLRGHVSGRPLVAVSALPMMLLVPVGTALGIAALVILRGERLRRAGRDMPATPGAFACAHLAPVAQASKAAGISVTERGDRRADIHCTPYTPSLQRLMPAGSPVVFEQWSGQDRSPLNSPRLVMRCTACDAALVFDGATGPLIPTSPGAA